MSLGAAELASGAEVLGRARWPDGGARRLRDKDPGLVPALLPLDSRRSGATWDRRCGGRSSPRGRWRRSLIRQGHPVGADTVGDLLREEGFSLQGNAKTIEGKQHPDRNAQFRYIAAQAEEHMAAGQPVISVDSRKREKVGRFARPGRAWRPKGDQVKVRNAAALLPVLAR